MADKLSPLPTTAGISCQSFYAKRAQQTSNAAKNKAAYRIVQEIPSSSSDDDFIDECSDDEFSDKSSDDEWLPEQNRDIGAMDDEDTDSQDAESENDEGQDEEAGQHDQRAVGDG
ncbi:coiled-coil domain-containing protein 1-like [Simochromis diagramma]|uniref:coiled-coil domain-containing protein 1-like n=1 Tax=Simochromis diagramma TaxID=43689 RepID=UPI001A7E6674|nr:coiled-coil domain-containing protein 1-like [Simochromis diagramma]